jgi:hypothetical protein
MQKLFTTNTVSLFVNRGDEFHGVVMKFIKNFISTPSLSRSELIKIKPDRLTVSIGNRTYPSITHDVILAGIVEELCDIYNVKKPAWIFLDQYFFYKETYLSSGELDSDSSAKTILKTTTPLQYARRKLFCGEMLSKLVEANTMTSNFNQQYNKSQTTMAS